MFRFAKFFAAVALLLVLALLWMMGGPYGKPMRPGSDHFDRHQGEKYGPVGKWLARCDRSCVNS